jgi:rhodanese-related sulfurtransferase
VSLAALTRKQVERLAPNDVAREVRNPDTILIDVRETWERSVFGTIPRAIHMPGGEIAAAAGQPAPLAGISPLARIITYCDSGARALAAADQLRRLGYLKVARLDGGLDAWRRAGHPVEWNG